MNLSILGSVGATMQIPHLRDGFAALGHTHVDDWTREDSELLFVGNPWFDGYVSHAALADKKVIFNVLDVPTHLDDFPMEKLRLQLSAADKVTCISKFTQFQLKQLLDVDAELIYYPMKPVSYTGVKHYPEAKVLIAGRVNDPNKRIGAAVKALIKAGYNESDVAVVGSENPHYGTYHGVVSDTKLNDLYNSVDYVMMLSRVEGIGLPAIEAAMCGAIPIVVPDLTTFSEFWADSPLGAHYRLLTSVDRIASLMRSINAKPDWKEEIKADMRAYAELAFRPKFAATEVAKRIIEVGEMI